jgi:hypothetical protein
VLHAAGARHQFCQLFNVVSQGGSKGGSTLDPQGFDAGKKVTGRKRHTGPMLASQRCGAKTHSGKPCRSPAVHGKKRCRMHGGAPGSGAPKNNQNALKHGQFTKGAIEERKQVQALIGQSRKLLRDIE